MLKRLRDVWYSISLLRKFAAVITLCASLYLIVLGHALYVYRETAHPEMGDFLKVLLHENHIRCYTTYVDKILTDMNQEKKEIFEEKWKDRLNLSVLVFNTIQGCAYIIKGDYSASIEIHRKYEVSFEQPLKREKLEEVIRKVEEDWDWDGICSIDHFDGKRAVIGYKLGVRADREYLRRTFSYTLYSLDYRSKKLLYYIEKISKDNKVTLRVRQLSIDPVND